MKARRAIPTNNDKPVPQYGGIGTGEYFVYQAGIPCLMPPLVGDDLNDVRMRGGIFCRAAPGLQLSAEDRGRKVPKATCSTAYCPSLHPGAVWQSRSSRRKRRQHIPHRDQQRPRRPRGGKPGYETGSDSRGIITHTGRTQRMLMAAEIYVTILTGSGLGDLFTGAGERMSSNLRKGADL